MSLNTELIKESFAKAKPIADKVADKFYSILWEDYPVSKALFEGVEMPRQKKALMGSLSFIVENVDNPGKLTPYLKDMGKRHVPYGTQSEHYDWVGQSLLKTFEFFFGEEWTEELQGEWETAFSFIAETMIEGAKEYTPQLSEIRTKAKQVCDDLLIEIVNEEVSKDFEDYVRAKVRRILLRVLEEESAELFDKAA